MAFEAQARYDEAEPLLLESLAVYESAALDKELTTTRRPSSTSTYTAWNRPEQAEAYRDGS